MEAYKRINKYLVDTYGLSGDNKPKFRLAWSEDLFEHRRGLHGELAVFETIERVPKYRMFKDRFVLEVYTHEFSMVFHKAITHKKDIVMDSDGYEILRVFQTKDGKYLPPDLEICKIICDAFCELINRPEGRRLTRAQASYADVEAMRLESAKFFELLNANDTNLAQQFHDKEAVIIHRSDV